MGPLTGYRVVEFAQGIAGPYCCMELADAGAEVIKVETFRGDKSRKWGRQTGDSSAFLSLNRNKKSIAVDMDSSKGLEIASQLASSADVVVVDANEWDYPELSYATLSQKNQQMVYCSISGYGHHGPWSNRKGAELPAQLFSETTLSLGKMNQSPVRMGISIGNMYTGIYSVQAICAALLARENMGEGQFIDVSLFGSLLAMRSTLWVALSNPDEWWGFHLDNYVKPPFHGYRCKDGLIYFQLRNPEKVNLDGLLEELQMTWVKDDPLYSFLRQDSAGGISRYSHKVHHLWETGFKNFTMNEVIKMVERNGGTAFPVNDYSMLVSQDQIKHLNFIRTIDCPGQGDMTLVEPPWKFSGTPINEFLPPPALGEHSIQILEQLGVQRNAIENLVKDNIILA